MAARLAETASVAVIEAGGVYEIENGNQSVVPYFELIMGALSISPSYPRQPLVDWDLVSVPQTGAGNRRIHYARGKTLGGCSALNTMGYHRGTVGTFQRWADLIGTKAIHGRKWNHTTRNRQRSHLRTWQKDFLQIQLSFTIPQHLTTHPTGPCKSPMGIGWM